MKLCSDEQDACYPICDYCSHYDFDKRRCQKYDRHQTPIDTCDDFECYTLKRKVE